MAKINISVEHKGLEVYKFEFIDENRKQLIGKEFKRSLLGFGLIQICFILLRFMGVEMNLLVTLLPVIVIGIFLSIMFVVFGVLFVLTWDSLIELRDEYNDLQK